MFGRICEHERTGVAVDAKTKEWWHVFAHHRRQMVEEGGVGKILAE
ncbi:hypothetical protein ACETU7_08030 [Rhodococcus sp. 3Y1]